VSGRQSKTRSFVGRQVAVLALAWLGLAPALAQTAPNRNPSRGALLYSTHCIACHSSQMHWRDNKLASDWPSLKAQVRRWQAAATLGWTEDDIVEVTRYLNSLYYGFPELRADAGTSPALAQRGTHGANRF
jgi:mono/diheme cytochrome c family protein